MNTMKHSPGSPEGEARTIVVHSQDPGVHPDGPVGAGDLLPDGHRPGRAHGDFGALQFAVDHYDPNRLVGTHDADFVDHRETGRTA
ncbi:hypothetical protein [Streptomyces sp. NPDC093990]|uniref:hypothetical protein n=1 Tax=Streptomyces sp. NPDC093990 TaxID=3155306 RepID=UPI00344381C1